MTKASPDCIPESIYRRHLLRAKASGNFFTFFRLYTRIMHKLDALFLQDLINLASMDRTRKTAMDGKEFFHCTVGYLENSGIGWTEKEQEYHFKALEAKGYVERIRKGTPPMRWVYIDLEKIERDLDEWELDSEFLEEEENGFHGNCSHGKQGDRSPRKGGDQSPGKQGVKKKDTMYPSVSNEEQTSRSAEPTVVYEDDSRRFKDQEFSKNGKHKDNVRSPKNDSPPDSFERKCTDKLWDAIVRSFPDEMRRIRSKNHWDKQFVWLRKSRSEEEITRVLDWYVYHLGDEYIPEAFSAKMFRLKFDPIRRAMKRAQKKQQEEMPIH